MWLGRSLIALVDGASRWGWDVGTQSTCRAVLTQRELRKEVREGFEISINGFFMVRGRLLNNVTMPSIPYLGGLPPRSIHNLSRAGPVCEYRAQTQLMPQGIEGRRICNLELMQGKQPRSKHILSSHSHSCSYMPLVVGGGLWGGISPSSLHPG